MCKFLHEYTFPVFLGVCIGMELLGHTVTPCLILASKNELVFNVIVFEDLFCVSFTHVFLDSYDTPEKKNTVIKIFDDVEYVVYRAHIISSRSQMVIFRTGILISGLS